MSDQVIGSSGASVQTSPDGLTEAQHSAGWVITDNQLRQIRALLELIVASGRDERIVGKVQHDRDQRNLAEVAGAAGRLLIDLHQWSLTPSPPAENDARSPSEASAGNLPPDEPS